MGCAAKLSRNLGVSLSRSRKTMKTAILRMLTAVVLVGGLSFVQGAGKHANRATQNLGLNQDQQTQVQSILQEQRQAMQDARAKGAPKSALKAIRQKTHDRMAGVLNPEQLQKFEAAAKQRRGKGKAKA